MEERNWYKTLRPKISKSRVCLEENLRKKFMNGSTSYVRRNFAMVRRSYEVVIVYLHRLDNAAGVDYLPGGEEAMTYIDRFLISVGNDSLCNSLAALLLKDRNAL